jgi:hypothetical protein
MGWSGGSELFNDIIRAVKPHVADKDVRKRIYQPIIEAFEDQDWDTQDECLGEDDAYDELYEEQYGDD